MPLSVPTSQQYPWDAPLSKHLAQLNHPTFGGINTWEIAPTVGVDGLALGTNHTGYTGVNSSTSTIERWNGSAWESILGGQKFIGLPAINIYVNGTSGNDSASGLSAGASVKTFSAVYKILMNVVTLEREVNIYLGAGIYTVEIPGNIQNNNINVIGQSSTAVTVQSLSVTNGNRVTVKGITFSNVNYSASKYWWMVGVGNSSLLNIGPDVVIGACAPLTTPFLVQNSSSLYFFVGSNLTITGSNYYRFIECTDATVAIVKQSDTSGTYVGKLNGNTYTNVIPPTASGQTLFTLNSQNTVAFGSSFLALGQGGIFVLSGFNTTGATVSMLVSGSISGLAYSVAGPIFANVSRGTTAPTTGSIVFPPSITPGQLLEGGSVVGTLSW